jgi:hypothetical protein
MRVVARDLENAGCRVTVVDLGFQDGFDIGDWIRPAQTGENRGLTKRLLIGLVDTMSRQPDLAQDVWALARGWHGWLSGGELSASVREGTSELVGSGSSSSPPESLPWNPGVAA